MHEQYKETLFGKKQLWHGMNMLRSEGHEIYGVHVNKISLSLFNSKRWIAQDGIHTYAYRYNPAQKKLICVLQKNIYNFCSGGKTVFGGTTSSSSRTKPRLGPSRK